LEIVSAEAVAQQSFEVQMKQSSQCLIALVMLALAGCENGAARREPIAVVLQAEKGESITLQIPRGYIEQPKKPEGVLSNVILRIAAKDFTAPDAFVPESEVRILIEPTASASDAGKQRHAAALRKARSSVDSLRKVDDKSKRGLIAYSYPNGEEDAEAYYLTSNTGDVFVECRRAVCSAYKTWRKRVHLRVDSQPADTADVAALDTAVDQMLQTFVTDTQAPK
jgi:hypothetical protein